MDDFTKKLLATCGLVPDKAKFIELIYARMKKKRYIKRMFSFFV